MRVLPIFIATLLVAITSIPRGYANTDFIHGLVPGYIAIQEALAADNLPGAKMKAIELQQKSVGQSAELKKISTSLTAFIEAKSISTARKEFKKLSTSFVDWADKNKESELEVVYCPMAGAKWLQKKGAISNPYFGKEMLHCGEKTS